MARYLETISVLVFIDLILIFFQPGHCRPFDSSFIWSHTKPDDRKCFLETRGMILIGGNNAMSNGIDIEQCKRACLEATDFECKAAVYYTSDQSCLLYDFNELDRPDLVLEATRSRNQPVLLNIASGDDCVTTTADPTATVTIPQSEESTERTFPNYLTQEDFDNIAKYANFEEPEDLDLMYNSNFFEGDIDLEGRDPNDL